MSGLPELKEDVDMIDVAARDDAEVGTGNGVANPAADAKAVPGGAQGGKKKKKGKK
jgi:hypothetical protein